MVAHQRPRSTQRLVCLPSCTLVETAYIHVNNSGYGWGDVLNEREEARGFW